MKRLLLLLASFYVLGAMAQNQTYRGTVEDANENAPLIGATVRIPGTTQGAITDANGTFSLEARSGDTLEVNYYGYVRQRLVLGTQTTLTIALSPGANSLDEVVVIGYGSKSKRDLTEAIGSISGATLERRPIARIENGIQGQVAGVQVTQTSGQPGSGLSIRVRGSTSISAGNDPLFVVDGVPVLTVEGINPADVASMEILKDASAAAIYGSRAANGVVLITTKQGFAGQTKVSYDTYFGATTILKTLPVLSGKEYAELINDEFAAIGQARRFDPDTVSVNTDWQNEVYRTAPAQQHQISFAGGDSRSQFFMSLSYLDQQGVIRESGFKRYTYRLNVNREIRSWLRTGANLTLSRVNFQTQPDNSRVNQGGVVLGALSSPPLIGIYRPDGTFTTNPLQAWENPVASILGATNTSTTNRALGNFFIEISPLKNLTFRSSNGIETYINTGNYFLDPFLTQFGRSLNGAAALSTNQEFIWLTENTLTYKINRGDHQVTLLGGWTAQESQYQNGYSRSENFQNSAVTTLNAGSRLVAASSSASSWALESYISRASYAFRGKYLVTANFRVDGSSRFGAGNRYAYFPSVSAGWRLSDEAFFPKNKVVTDAKIRGSYGLTGNQNIGDFSSFGLYSFGSNYNFNGAVASGIRPSTIGNSNLRWETTAQTDLGLDLAFWNGKVVLTTDYYIKQTNDLLLNVNLPASTGFGSGIRNLGEVRNSGWELSVNTYQVDRKDASWTSSFNLSLNRNEVVNIGGEGSETFTGAIPENGFSVIVKEGLPLGTFFGYVAEGVDPETGNMVFADLNEDGVINDDDRTVIGDANPDFIWGINNSIRWKNLRLDFLWQGVHGNEIFNATRIETEGMFSVKNASAATLTRWREQGDVTDMPKATFGDPFRNARVSSRFIEDGSYVRLRSAALSWSLPQMWLSPIGISNFEVYVSGQNLLTFTAYSGYDPEVNRDGNSSTSLGIDYGTYPQARTLTGGIRLDF